MKTVLILLSLVSLILCIFLFYHSFNKKINIDGLQNELNRAYQNYQEAELTQTVGERKEKFNVALSIYLDIENSSNPVFGNGKLYFNIGNTFFQLDEYPLAILYYYRALYLLPRFSEIRHNLHIAQEKLRLTPTDEKTSFFYPLFSYFSLPEKLQIIFVIELILIFFSSIYVWYPKKWIKKALLAPALVGLFLLWNLAYSRYLEPLEGVLIKTTSLYRDAGKQYAKVSEQVFQGGVKVKILDSKDEGRWLKILTPNGFLGNVPIENIRIIKDDNP